MRQDDTNLKSNNKLTKSGQPQKLRMSLWVSPEDKEMIVNRKTDRDLSTNIFLMRIIRKYFAEHKDELIVGVKGSVCYHANNPTNTTNTSYIKPSPNPAIGGPKSTW
jgi:hypothetical protein